MLELDRQIALATEVIRVGNIRAVAVVTESRLTERARRTYWGFHFTRFETIPLVGHEIENADGTFSVVRATVYPQTKIVVTK